MIADPQDEEEGQVDEEAEFEAETLKAIRRGLEEMKAGKTIDAAIVHQRLREL